MSAKPLTAVLRYLRRVAQAGPEAAGDAGLLARFVIRNDEAAFERLVSLHGPMVLGLCRRLLRQEQDAEDAFQATFLILARKAGAIGKHEALAGWLYKVAYRVACRALPRTLVLTNVPPVILDRPAREPDADVIWRDLRGVLDREIAALSESYRLPIVLCYFQGKSNEEAARLLGCPQGTLAARLSRARDQLRRRLTRRGWTLSGALFTTVLSEKAASAAVPRALIGVTVESALAFVSNASVGAAASEKVVTLAEGALRAMWLNKLKMTAGVILAVVLAGAGVGLVARQTWASGGPDKVEAGRNDAPAQKGKVKPKAEAADDSTAEVAKLRAEIAELRKEIKSLTEAVRQGTAAPQEGLTYQGKPTAFWLAKLKDADPNYRIEAVTALAFLARQDERLYSVYVDTFKDENVVDTAAQGVVILKPTIVPMLAAALKAYDVNARRFLYDALGRFGFEAKPAIPAIIEALGASLQSKNPLAETDYIRNALLNIDEKLGRDLPGVGPDGLYLSPTADAEAAAWRKAYEKLKAKYQKQK
jgi:RNA polymerase sigma factor (sigma-70 family)